MYLRLCSSTRTAEQSMCDLQPTKRDCFGLCDCCGLLDCLAFSLSSFLCIKLYMHSKCISKCTSYITCFTAVNFFQNNTEELSIIHQMESQTVLAVTERTKSQDSYSRNLLSINKQTSICKQKWLGLSIAKKKNTAVMLTHKLHSVFPQVPRKCSTNETKGATNSKPWDALFRKNLPLKK